MTDSPQDYFVIAQNNYKISLFTSKIGGGECGSYPEQLIMSITGNCNGKTPLVIKADSKFGNSEWTFTEGDWSATIVCKFGSMVYTVKDFDDEIYQGSVDIISKLPFSAQFSYMSKFCNGYQYINIS